MTVPSTPDRAQTRTTRRRGGIYSHSCDRIVFRDNVPRRSDLKRLNPTRHGLPAQYHRHRSETVQLGTDIYPRVTSDGSGITLTAPASDHVSGLVLTGVGVEALSHRLTPVALTTPTRVTMEFDITWEAGQARTDTVGECG